MDRPVLFSAPMVRAVLAGTKTQTRRAVRKQFAADATVAEVGATTPEGWQVSGHSGLWWDDAGACIDDAVRCPYGQPGDRLRVKEAAWMWCERRPNGKTKTGRDKWLYAPMREAPVHYAADHPERPAIDVVSPATGNEWGWRLKIGRFMPRWASRITLDVLSVRVERLQDISEADALAEGVTPKWEPGCSGRLMEAFSGFSFRPATSAYADLWEQINGPGSWMLNPWVWVVEFKRAEA